MSLSVIVFVASGVFVLYVLVGYPLGLALWARLSSKKPIHKAFIPKRITIVIPVRNGANWIEAKLRSLLASHYPPGLMDVLVVSDGSTDATDEIVDSFGDRRVRLLSLPGGGKATAVTRGLEQVSSEIVVLTDVRQPLEPEAIRNMVACFADPSVGVVTGELIIREGSTLEEFNTGLYWKYEKWIRKNLNRVDAMLGASGSIYAVRREALAPIPREVLLDDVYLPFIAVFKGFQIYFDEDAKAYDLPTSLHSEFKRKVRTQAGVYQIIRYFPGLLLPSNRRFIPFVSHKLGRLLLPFALIALAISSFGLPPRLATIATGCQMLWYGAALIDFVLPPGSIFERLTGPIRAFTVLIAAALCAISVFVLPAQNLWRETKVATAREPTHTGSR